MPRRHRVVDRVVDEGRRQAAFDEAAFVAQERVAAAGVQSLAQIVGQRRIDDLIAIRGEHPCEPADRDAGREIEPAPDLAVVDALRAERVVDLSRIDAAAGGHRPAKDERLAERQLVVGRSGPALQRHGHAFAASEEIRRRVGKVQEQPFVLRGAGAEGQLVPVLLLDLDPHVDLRVVAGRPLDRDRLLVERLEVAELIDPPDAVLERLRIEDAALDQAHLAADDVVARLAVADEGDAIDEVLLPFGHLDGHVDGRRLGAVTRGEIGIRGELEVAAGAVELPGALETLGDPLVAIRLARSSSETAAAALRPRRRRCLRTPSCRARSARPR